LPPGWQSLKSGPQPRRGRRSASPETRSSPATRCGDGHWRLGIAGEKYKPWVAAAGWVPRLVPACAGSQSWRGRGSQTAASGCRGGVTWRSKQRLAHSQFCQRARADHDPLRQKAIALQGRQHPQRYIQRQADQHRYRRQFQGGQKAPSDQRRDLAALAQLIANSPSTTLAMKWLNCTTNGSSSPRSARNCSRYRGVVSCPNRLVTGSLTNWNHMKTTPASVSITINACNRRRRTQATIQGRTNWAQSRNRSGSSANCISSAKGETPGASRLGTQPM
jgi:hypothetical protein